MFKIFEHLSEKSIKSILKASGQLALFQIIAMLPMLIIMYVMSFMIRNQGNTSDDNTILYMCILIGTILVILLFLSYKKMYKLKYLTTAKENLHLRMGVMDKMRRLPESYLSKHDLSDLTSTVMDDIGTIEGVLANQVTEMIGGFTAMAITLIAMYFVNVKMALALTMVVPLVILSMSLADTVSGKTHMKNRIARIAISDGIQEYLENIKVLKISGSIDEYQRGLHVRMRRLIPGLVLFEFLSGMCVSAAFNFLRMGIGVVAVYGANLLVKGEISVMTYITFLLMAVWIYEPMSYSCEHLGAVIASKVAATRIDNILKSEEQTGSSDIEIGDYDICFDNVSFAYDQDKEKVLDNVSFTAHCGEYTALVGSSGSGKSTIAKLAARLWDADSGTITVGGVDISKIAPEEFLKNVSIVFQDVTLFNDTVYNNILIGRKDATREEVMKAAEYAECLSFINKLPEGIDTVIGENGHTLSGGERQRLSIARAFLKNAPIVLLDESTASIDPETETKIQSAIEKLTRGKTVLMIAHRLRSIVGCDRIVVLENGKIAGNGSHEELMKNCDVYAKLYNLQNEGEMTVR